jgi:16S rRNA A1518/A1519 N6-dimethyltransferase RsmA/KsgA/DIM1 with predicted DNA glycosylase/AP lyase activity
LKGAYFENFLLGRGDQFYFCGAGEGYEVLKFCFGKKRKQLLGTLTEYLGDRTKAISVLQKSDIPEKTRPETLSKEEWRRLTEYIQD